MFVTSGLRLLTSTAVSLKNRVGSFLLLAGLIFLLLFAASVLAESGKYDLTSFLAGAAAMGLGWHWRFAKSARPQGPPAQPAGPAGPPPAAAPPKKHGPLAFLLHGPAKKKTAPVVKPPPPPPPKKGLAKLFGGRGKK